MKFTTKEKDELAVAKRKDKEGPFVELLVETDTGGALVFLTPKIKPGQIWREKRTADPTGWKREVRVLDLCNGRVSYVPDNYRRAGRQVFRPIQEQYFRDGYELVNAPTEAQKEQRCERS